MTTTSRDWGEYASSTKPKKKPKKKAPVRGNAAKRKPSKKGNRTMARKLYGAAKKAHAKKSRARKAKARRRKASSTTTRKRRKPAKRRTKRKSAKAVAAGKKGARTRKRKAAARRKSRRAAPKRRRRRSVSVTVRANPKRRRRRTTRKTARRRTARRNPAKRRRRRRNPRPSTQRSMLRARRSIRNRYKTPLGKATKRRYRMRSNPMGKATTMGDILKMTLPIAASLYGARALSFKVAGKIPGFNNIPVKFQGISMAGLLFVGAHFATKKIKPLQKFRGGIMIGTGLNLIDNVVSAFAPANVKSMFGLGDNGIYDEAMSDYVEIGDYVSIGDAPPIDDDITLSDYIEVGDVEEELGQIEEELGLGVEEELGQMYAPTGADGLPANAWQRPKLGGVMPGSMLRNIPRRATEAAIPARSFTKRIPHAGAGYDKPGVLYGGIFSGGFGC
jgi:hypothetical protein